jgi:Ethylbenzene dehydrogenase
MTKPTSKRYQKTLKYSLIAGSILGSQLSFAAAPSDWSAVETHAVKLFYPGQSSYQWLLSKEHKRANKQVAKGEACTSCHEGEEADMGAAIVSGDKLEPHPIAGKSAVKDLDLKVAYDDTNVYFHLKWKTDNDFPGTAHPHWQFDGENWKQIGWPKLHKKVWKDKQPAIYEDRFSMMIDDGSVEDFATQGCWISCHSSMRDMEDVTPGDDVKAHAQLGKGLKKKDVRKYLPASRTDENASWNTLQTDEKIAELKEQGQFVDLMQWRAHRSKAIDMADDGYVFEYRLTDEGKNIFSKNWDKKLKQPKYMYDKAKVGFSSRTLDTIRDQSQPSSLVEGENTVPFDPNASWKTGDMVPEYYVTKKSASGSAADNAMVTSNWNAGYWTIEWERKLDTGHPKDDKIFKEGKSYTFGFAIHDDNITTRGHHVSFPVSIGFGTNADIKAQKVK